MCRVVDENYGKIILDQAHQSTPSPVDAYVGSRIRLCRTSLGMSQEYLGDALGVTFQQIQKYERGINRVGASRLFDMSRVMSVPVSYFFDDMSPDVWEGPVSGPRGRMSQATGRERSSDSQMNDQLHKQETRQLIAAYYQIREPSIRKSVLDLIISLAPANGDLSRLTPRKAT